MIRPEKEEVGMLAILKLPGGSFNQTTFVWAIHFDRDRLKIEWCDFKSCPLYNKGWTQTTFDIPKKTKFTHKLCKRSN